MRGPSLPLTRDTLLSPVVLPALIAAAMLLPIQPATAGPVFDGATLLATNVEGAGARLALSSGKFVEDTANGWIDVVDRNGRLVEQVVPQVLVDGVVMPLELTIGGAGRELSARVMGVVTEGARIAASGVRRAGAAAEACVDKGLSTAVVAGLIAAITGGLLAVLSLNPVGILTAAALAGMAGAWSGFTEGCARGALESLQHPEATSVHELDQIAL
ncbi:hypothetical protein [Nocardia sp. NBC_00511]|uniref:hypothetical protein n=1 Tax=Nocardia sp. NBC_00511 TaxID=2903591 RepID=UPI0030E28EF7